MHRRPAVFTRARRRQRASSRRYHTVSNPPLAHQQHANSRDCPLLHLFYLHPIPPSAAHSASRASTSLSQITIACTFSERAHAEFAAASSSTATTSAAEPTGADAPLPPTVGAYDACAAEIKLWPIHRSAESDALSPPLDVRIVHPRASGAAMPARLGGLPPSADGAQPLLESDLEEMRTEDAPPPSKLDDIAWSSVPPPRQRSLGGCAMSLVGHYARPRLNRACLRSGRAQSSSHGRSYSTSRRLVVDLQEHRPPQQPCW